MAKKILGGTQFYFAFKSSVMSQGCWKMPLLTLEIGGKWVVNVFSSFEQKRLILYRNIGKSWLSAVFQHFDHFKMEISP